MFQNNPKFPIHTAVGQACDMIVAEEKKEQQLIEEVRKVMKLDEVGYYDSIFQHSDLDQLKAYVEDLKYRKGVIETLIDIRTNKLKCVEVRDAVN